MKILVVALMACLSAPCLALAEHPQILSTPTDRDAILRKIENAPWAKEAYATLKAKVDVSLAHTEVEPQWLTSRLQMNWQTHYVTPITQGERLVGGEGYASVPTPRFAGARDWKTDYGAPTDLADLRPFNDQDGKLWLVNRVTGQGEWVAPGVTGRTIEAINERIVQLAADAAFIYWITGEEKYARFAAPILWTYMEGFFQVQPPRIADQNKGSAKIIGVTSFEVIHENIVIPLSESYDFLHDYLTRQGKDVGVIQTGLKRFADRVITGGGREGNWNLNQAMMIAYAGLALEDDATYPDAKGRPYYVDVVLNANLPAQNGLTRVIKESYDQETALWPEAPGYGFGATQQLVQLASLMSADPAGRAVLIDPMPTRAVLAQMELIYPNGFSVGLGDTDNTRLNAGALEFLIAAARKNGKPEAEARLTAVLQREIDSGNYQRGQQANIVALTQYVDELRPVPATAPLADRTYFGKPLNLLMQRNPAAPEDSLAAAMFGTEGGHIHSNGLAIELFGAGLIMGADPGRGSSYWQADHGEYYSQPPAHNTVIVNGRSDYPAYGKPQSAMTVEAVEPAFGQRGVCEDISFATASFHYSTPEAGQLRTLALVRTGPKSGFYYDVFRSRAGQESGEFHDYLYHNIGQSVAITDGTGSPLPLAASGALGSQHGDLKGYDYFKHSMAADFEQDFRAAFTVELPGQKPRQMNLWMPGQPGRTIFSTEAPGDHAGRTALPAGMSDLPMPTVIVRQRGEAWRHPFVAVYEPVVGMHGGTIRKVSAASVEAPAAGLDATVVTGEGYRVLLAQSDDPARASQVDGRAFQGTFGVVFERAGAVAEMYLGHGRKLGDARLGLTAPTGAPVDAAIHRQDQGWSCSASAPVRVGLVFQWPPGGGPLSSWTVLRKGSAGQAPADKVELREDTLPDGTKIIAAACNVPMGQDQRLTLGKSEP